MAAAFVQHLAETDGNGVTTTSTVLSPSSKTVTQGNVIVAGVSGIDGLGTTPSCVDNLGNTYTLVRPNRAAAEDGAMFVAPVTTGGSITSITFTHATTRNRSAEAAEWSGVDATNWVDGLGSPADSNPGTTITGIGDVVSIPANGMAVWFSAGNTNQTYSAGAASGSPSMTPVLADAHASANMSCGILYALAGTTTVSYFRGRTTVTGTGGYTSYGAIFNVPYAPLNGQYGLESAVSDGYLLEDGSGVIVGEETAVDVTGTFAASHGGGYTGSFTAAETITGTMAGAHGGAYLGSFTAAETITGTMAGAHGGGYLGSFTAAETFTGTVAGAHGGVYGSSFTGEVINPITGTFAGAHGGVYGGSFTGEVINPITGTFASSHGGGYLGSFTAAETMAGTFASSLGGGYLGSFTGTEEMTGTLSGTAPSPESLFTGTEEMSGTFDSTAPGPSASFTGLGGAQAEPGSSSGGVDPQGSSSGRVLVGSSSGGVDQVGGSS